MIPLKRHLECTYYLIFVGGVSVVSPINGHRVRLEFRLVPLNNDPFFRSKS